MTPSKTASCRPVSPLNSKLERQLTAYGAVAGAACLGILATPQLTQAEIVYTSANISITGRDSVALDLNQDGIADFELVTRFCGSHSTCLVVDALVLGNGIRGAGSTAFAGFFGVPVGPGEKFLHGNVNSVYGGALMALAGGYGPYSWSGGPWAHTTNRYLGLRLVINGQTHYGWARLNVDLLVSGKTVITGYAYETIPNQTIHEGQTHEMTASNLPSLNPVRHEVSLGMLARGVDGLTLWRRDEKTLQ